MERYEVLIDDIDFEGVYAISIVEFPAIEEDFMKFSKNNKLLLAQIDEEKRIIIGPAMIPDKDIVRIDDFGNPYNIFFTKKTIEACAYNYLLNNKLSNITLEHSVELNDVSVIESWIVNDTNMDKSKALGYNVPIGTWMISMKVNNDTAWTYIKNGFINGFSIEGHFSRKFSEFSKQELTDEELLNEIIKILDDKN